MEAGNFTPAQAEDQANNVLAIIESWTSLASVAVVQFYSEWEPPAAGADFLRGFFRWPGGMHPDVSKILRELTGKFGGVLKKTAGILGATAYSISIGIPSGVSVGLEWTPSEIISIARGRKPSAPAD
jgi:hypothetical protein